MKKVIALALFIGSVGLTANAQDAYENVSSCSAGFTCTGVSTGNMMCPYDVAIEKIGDRSQWSSAGCFKTRAAANAAAKKLAQKGKCEFVESE